MSNPSKEELRKQIDELVDDVTPGNDWCEDCDHPRCLSNKKAFKANILALLDTYSKQREVEALRPVLERLLEQLAKQAITTLDTKPQGIDRAKIIPVGAFVRFDDLRSAVQAELEKSRDE